MSASLLKFHLLFIQQPFLHSFKHFLFSSKFQILIKALRWLRPRLWDLRRRLRDKKLKLYDLAKCPMRKSSKSNVTFFTNQYMVVEFRFVCNSYCYVTWDVLRFILRSLFLLLLMNGGLLAILRKSKNNCPFKMRQLDFMKAHWNGAFKVIRSQFEILSRHWIKSSRHTVLPNHGFHIYCPNNIIDVLSTGFGLP